MTNHNALPMPEEPNLPNDGKNIDPMENIRLLANLRNIYDFVKEEDAQARERMVAASDEIDTELLNRLMQVKEIASDNEIVPSPYDEVVWVPRLREADPLIDPRIADMERMVMRFPAPDQLTREFHGLGPLTQVHDIYIEFEHRDGTNQRYLFNTLGIKPYTTSYELIPANDLSTIADEDDQPFDGVLYFSTVNLYETPQPASDADELSLLQLSQIIKRFHIQPQDTSEAA